MAHILVVDDEKALVWAIGETLRFNGYSVSGAFDGLDALQQIQERTPDLLVLDILMPRMDGFEVCQHLRVDPKLKLIPILFLTACSEIRDKLAAYEAGADDYLVKPFDIRELVVRVRALLRRYQLQERMESRPKARVRHLRVGQLHLDLDTATVTAEHGSASLTPVERDLLKYLMQHPDQIFSSARLLEAVWEFPPGTGDPALVRWHVKNLRRKIELNPNCPAYLRTVPRHGYILITPSAPS